LKTTGKNFPKNIKKQTKGIFIALKSTSRLWRSKNGPDTH